jgi:RecA-family ATPase
MPTDVLRAAEQALEARDAAQDVARAYLDRAEQAGVLTELVALLRQYDGPAADGMVLDHLLERRSGGAPDSGHHGRLVNLADVQPEVVRWLWPGRIPLGKLTMLDGDPGVLKSTMTLDLAARLSRGTTMPDGAASDLEGPRGTVLLTAEDGLADTIRPRLDAARADVSRVVALKAIPTKDGERLPTVDDVEPLREAIEAVDAALVVVDPLVAYLGADVNSYRDQDVRAALAGLAELADETGVAVLAVRHLNKSGGDNPIHRGGGSIGLIAAARSGLLVARDPEEPDGDRRILAATKANLAPELPALAFRPKVVDGVVAVDWEGETKHAARDLLSTASREERSAREEAADILREELRNGPVPVEELKALAERHGMSFKTFRRAKESVGVVAVREGFGSAGRWSWRIDGQSPCPSKADSELSTYGNGAEGQGVSGDGDSIDGQSPDMSTYGDSEPPEDDLDDSLALELGIQE